MQIDRLNEHVWHNDSIHCAWVQVSHCVIPSCEGPFSKLRKLANWQLADCNRHINCDHQGPERGFETSLISVQSTK